MLIQVPSLEKFINKLKKKSITPFPLFSFQIFGAKPGGNAEFQLKCPLSQVITATMNFNELKIIISTQFDFISCIAKKIIIILPVLKKSFQSILITEFICVSLTK